MSARRNDDVLVIGAGIAGIEASLLLSKAGRHVHLVETSSFTGGMVVLFEQVYPTFECATCLLSPRQQDLLQDPNIHLMTLSEVVDVHDASEGFDVTIRNRARYINSDACIGCGACYEPCPVILPNEVEMGLVARKAIYIPFAGALPNVPTIDKAACLHLQGGDCQKCKEACAFEAVDLEQKDKEVHVFVEAIIVATGSKTVDLKNMTRYGYGSLREVYSSLEFERLFSSNGPTDGRIVLRNGKSPRSVALLHCVGRDETGYCSSVCCMYLLKFNQYLRTKLPEVEIHEFFTELTIPGQASQRFFMKMMEGGTDLVRARNLRLEGRGERLVVLFEDSTSKEMERVVDMAILAPALVPREDASILAARLGISRDTFGYVSEGTNGPVSTSRTRVHVIGAAQEPMGIDSAVNEAFAAVAKVLGSKEVR
jgi:heterodisulfide reductase subunit A